MGWAAYIVLSRVVGQRCVGLHGTALATAVVAVLYAPVAAALIASGKLWGAALAAVAAGILSSAIPYTADAMALRRVPPGLFAFFTNLNPIWAAVIGMVVLRQFLAAHEWIGMTCIAAANAAAVISHRRTSPTLASSP